MRITSAPARLIALAVCALTCAVLAGLIAIPAPWSDPFVYDVWLGLTLTCAVIGFAYAAFTLWETKLTVTVPIVMCATITASAITAYYNSILSVPVSMTVGLAAMGGCRRWSPRRSPACEVGAPPRSN